MVIIVYQKFHQVAPTSLTSLTPSTHLPRTELSCCQRWFGRPHLVCLLRQLSMPSNLIEKNHPTEDNSVSFPLGQSSSCEAACSITQLYLTIVTMSSILFLVRLAGIEPARPKARDFKSLVSTDFTTVALILVPQERLELSKYGF